MKEGFMNILENLLSTEGSGIVSQLANQFGISSEQATSAVSSLLPALAGGMKEMLASNQGSGLSDLIGGGSLSKFTDAASLATPAAREQGNALLTSIFGSGDLSKMVSMVAEKAGVDGSVITRMLPVAMTALGAFLSKRAAGGENLVDTVDSLASVGHEGILGAIKSLTAKIFA
jgi:hypothetical protein